MQRKFGLGTGRIPFDAGEEDGAHRDTVKAPAAKLTPDLQPDQTICAGYLVEFADTCQKPFVVLLA